MYTHMRTHTNIHISQHACKHLHTHNLRLNARTYSRKCAQAHFNGKLVRACHVCGRRGRSWCLSAAGLQPVESSLADNKVSTLRACVHCVHHVVRTESCGSKPLLFRHLSGRCKGTGSATEESAPLQVELPAPWLGFMATSAFF